MHLVSNNGVQLNLSLSQPGCDLLCICADVLIGQMCSLWKSWVWVCWLVWRRWWGSNGTGGTSLKPTSVCSETLPFRSGCAPRALSTTTTRKTNHTRLEHSDSWLDLSKAALVRKVTQKSRLCRAACYCCLDLIPWGGSTAHRAPSSWMTLSSCSCSEHEVIAAVTVGALFHSFCLCSTAASVFSCTLNTQISLYLRYYFTLWVFYQ